MNMMQRSESALERRRYACGDLLVPKRRYACKISGLEHELIYVACWVGYGNTKLSDDGWLDYRGKRSDRIAARPSMPDDCVNYGKPLQEAKRILSKEDPEAEYWRPSWNGQVAHIAPGQKVGFRSATLGSPA